MSYRRHPFKNSERGLPSVALSPAVLSCLWMVVLAALWMGCGVTPREHCEGPSKVERRWVESEKLGPGPSLVGHRLPVYRDHEAFAWLLRDESDLASWHMVNLDRAWYFGDYGLRMVTPSSDPMLARTVSFDADEVHEIRVQMGGLKTRSRVQLFWAHGETEPFSETKSLEVDQPTLEGQLIPVYTFQVSDHPDWNGRIARIRLDPTIFSLDEVELVSVRGLRRELDPELLQAAMDRPFKVDLGADVRNALASLPGFSPRLDLDIPPRAELRFAFGLQLGLASPVDFKVVLSGGTGGQGTQFLSEQVLFEQRLDPSDPGHMKRWHDQRIALPERTGAWLELRAEHADGSPLNPLDGSPVWALPEILAPPVVAAKKSESVGSDPPNVVMIVVDTLRADRLHLYGYDRPTSPRLDEWAARRGVVFEKAVASAPWTLPSHVSLFTGLDAVAHGVNYHHDAPAELELLAERLRDGGYSTAAFTGGAYLAARYGLAQGFDRLVYWSETPQPSAKADDELESGLLGAIQWLETSTEPFFLFLHTYEVHSPYRAREPWYTEFGGPPLKPLTGLADSSARMRTDVLLPKQEEGYRSLSQLLERDADDTWNPFTGPDQGQLDALYDSGIANADHAIGQLLDHLRESGLEERTLVLITSDHGEGLGERDAHGEPVFGHRHLYDSHLLVPLIGAWPDGRAGGSRISSQVRLIDVTPTVLDSVGLEIPEGLDGVSLLPLVEDPSAEAPGTAFSYAGSSNFGLSARMANTRKVIYNHTPWPPLHGRIETFDLRRDAGENEILAPDPKRDRAVTALLREHFDRGAYGKVELANHTEAVLEVTLQGEVSHAFTVKAFELPCGDCAGWADGQATVELAPGTEIELSLDAPPHGQLRVRARWLDDRPSGSLERDFEVVDFRRQAWRAFWLDGQWQQGPEPTLGQESGVAIHWQSGLRSRATPNQTMDREMQERLRSLGYLVD